MAKKDETYLDCLTPELKSEFERIEKSGFYDRRGEWVDQNVARATLRSMIKRTIKNVLQKPRSPKADVSMAIAKNMLRGYKSEFKSMDVYQAVTELLVQALAKDYPDVAAKYLQGIYKKCDPEYIHNLYEATKDKRFLDLMVARLEYAARNEKAPKIFGEKALCYRYAVIAKNKTLLEFSMKDTEDYAYIKEKTLNYLKDIDYVPFLVHLKQSKLSVLSFEGCKIAPEMAEQFFSGYENLTRIEYHQGKSDSETNTSSDALNKATGREITELSADLLLQNSKLTQIDMSGVKIVNPEKLIEKLPRLLYLTLRECEDIQAFYDALMARNPEYTKIWELKIGHCDSKAFYQLLMEKCPECLKNIETNFTRMQANALMQKHLTLLVKDGDEHDFDKGFYRRNGYIQDAENCKTHELMERIVGAGYFIEYLQAVDQSERPGFDELSKEYGYYHIKTIWTELQSEYKEDYLQILDKVYELCDFKDHQKEADIFRAVQHQELFEYIKALPEDERPSVRCLAEPLVEGGVTLWQEIRRAYEDEQTKPLVSDFLELSVPNEEELKLLQDYSKKIGDAELVEMVTEYIDRQAHQKKSEKNNVASKAAFEQWKKEHQKGI